MKRFTKASLVCVLGLVIAGCGGGGGGGDDDVLGDPTVAVPVQEPAPGQEVTPPAPDPSFNLTATVDGAAVTSFQVANGQSGTLNVQSGQEVVLTSSAGVTWTVQSAPAEVSYTEVKAPTEKVLDYKLSSAQGGSIVLSVASKIDGTVISTVTVVVAPQRYTPKDAVLGAQSEYAVSDTYVDASTQSSSYTRETVMVNSDGSYTTNSINSSNLVTDTYTANAEGNRLTRTYVNGGSTGNVCSYAPSREWLNFPMFVGKTWTSTWNYSCTFGYQETANLNASVTNAEKVTVPTGTYDALRVRLDTLLTNSNDTNLTNGSTGAASYRIVTIAWYAPSLGQYVKFERDYTYVGVEPNSYIRNEVETLVSQTQPQ